jgi:hypothetical protein
VSQRSMEEANGTKQPRMSVSSDRSASSRNASPMEDEDRSAEEEVNLEYLRNVILQFLEHKEMRVRNSRESLEYTANDVFQQANLVRVLSTILRFTPQETRRLMTKI